MEDTFELDCDGRFAELVDEFDFGEPMKGSGLDARHAHAAPSVPVDVFAELESSLDAAQAAQFSANRAMAQQLDAIRAAVESARRHPLLYLQPAFAGARDAAELAERSVVAELSMRLRIAEATVRAQAHEARMLQQQLPRVWARFAEGIATYVDARAAVEQLTGLKVDAEVLDGFDFELAAVIGTVPPARFRARARAMRARLERDSLEALHTRAIAERRVVIDAADDGMAWVQVLISAVDAARIRARLDARAREASTEPGETRSRDQIRADLAAEWLAGTGTPFAPATQVVVTVPVLSLIGADEAPATLDGYGPIDPAIARQLFADAPSFLRVAVDPISSAPLDLDRTRYRPSKAQRDWLALRYGTCTRPGCSKLAVDSDVDHLHDWFLGGRTDEANLLPLCRNHHRLKHATKFSVARAADGTVSWTSPTGFTATTDPPPF
jgi:hypothetical protein